MKISNLRRSPLAAPGSAGRGFVIAGILAALSIAGPANAAITYSEGPTPFVTFSFDKVVTGGTPGGEAPWVNVTFTDKAPNVVTALFEVPATGLASSEYLTKFFFNYDPLLTGTFAVSDPVVTPSGAKADFTFDYTSPSGAGAGFNFDLLISYATAGNDGGTKRLVAGETVQFDLTYTPSDTPSGSSVEFDSLDFLFRSAKNDGTPGPYAEAHLQGIVGEKDKDKDKDSAWVEAWVGPEGPQPFLTPIPEPGSSLALISLLASGVTLRSRRRR